jgi:4-hydroxybenzoate polyprenyltransferase
MGSTVVSYLRLMRLPNVATAWADMVVGFLIVRTVFSGGDWGTFPFLLLATTGLYLAGMVFNDIADRDEDARERPHRPIPSGAVTLKGAARCGSWLLLLGVLSAVAAGAFAPQGFSCAPALWSLMLAAAILFYDFGAKGTALGGPLVLGLCRFLNVQMASSTAPGFMANLADVGLFAAFFSPALAVGLYAAGVTAFSAQEERGKRTRAIALGWLFVAAGLGCAGFFSPQIWVWPGIVLLLAVTIWNTSQLTRTGTPSAARNLVRFGVMGICVLDASLIVGHAGTGAWSYAVATVLLLIPGLLLARLLAQKEA